MLGRVRRLFSQKQRVMNSDSGSPTGVGTNEARVAAAGTAAPSSAYAFGKYFWATLLLFILTVIYVNPFWNTAVDDDWSYALTVKHLLDTGHYKLHDWATANMPFQVYWGALFAKLAGYSHASLRISTLVIWLLGLIAFYCLALEHRFAPEEAGLLMLTLFSSPILVKMSFSFMTDVPYLSCFIVTLFIWTRALRTRHLGLMFLGSMAAAAAILTRQFGAALIGGLILVWLAHRERGRDASLFGVGLLLPLVALGFQFRESYLEPTWAMKWNLIHEAEYFLHPSMLLKGLLWRPVIVLEYLAFLTPPLVLLPLAGLIGRRRTAAGHGRSASRVSTLLVLVGVWAVGALVVSGLWRMVPWLMPYLGWNFDVVGRFPVFARATLTGLTTLGAILLGWTFAQIYLRPFGHDDTRCFERLVDLTTLCVAGELLAFWAVGDEYLLPLLPYSLLVAGRQFRSNLARLKRPLVICCLGVLAFSNLFARWNLASIEAPWRAAEAVRMTGVDTREISSSFEWMGYYCFETFVAEHQNESPDVGNFITWTEAQGARRRYIVVGKSTSADLRNYELFTQITYTPLPYWYHKLYVLRRIAPPPPG